MPDPYDDPDLDLADQWSLEQFREWLYEYDPDERRMLPVESARRVVTVAPLPDADVLVRRLAEVGR